MEKELDIYKRWAKEGFSCGTWVDPPGQTWEDFVHGTDEKVYVLEGELELKVDRKLMTLGSGDEALIPARAYHSVRNIGGRTAKWLYGYPEVEHLWDRSHEMKMPGHSTHFYEALRKQCQWYTFSRAA